jgi:hypothetical protein
VLHPRWTAITTDGATAKTYEESAGEVIIQPTGWFGARDVTEAIRRVYSIGVSGAV